MNSSTTNNAAAKTTKTYHSSSTATGETKSSAPSPTTSFKTSTAPVALPSQVVMHPAPSLRSSCMQRKWQWIPVQIETSEETWIFLHPIDKIHQVCVQASPSTEMPSLLVQSELISSEYKKQHGISYEHLLQHWIRIYSYLQPSFPQRIGMRCLCRLFDAVERLMTENSRHSILMLMPIPSGMWTMFPNVNYHNLGGLIKWVNGVVEESPDSAPQLLFLQDPNVNHDTLLSGWINGNVEVNPDSAPRLLFLQEGALEQEGAQDKHDGKVEVNFSEMFRSYLNLGYNIQSLSGACVIVDETGCFHLRGENVTDDNVVRVAREYSNLESLNLEGCSNITDASVSEVGRGCLSLQSLNLSFCRNITDASVSEVARGCAKLQSLGISYTNITSACKNALRQSHPKLELRG